MTITVNVQELHVHLAPRHLEASLSTILTQLENILMKQSEGAAALVAVATTLDKVSGETTQLLVEVQTLKDLLGQADEVSPELQAAIDAVASRAAAIDALVPDATP